MIGKIVVSGSLVLSCLAGASARAEDYVYEFAPEVSRSTPRNASASKFVWAADGTVSDGAVAYLRYKITLESVPVYALLYYYLDDGGTVYVNGNALKSQGSAAFQHLVAGENTIAVELTNKAHASGLIFTLNCYDSSDAATRKVVASYHSDETGRATVIKPSDGWVQPAFDDSSWPAVKVLGDAFSEPWYASGAWYYTEGHLQHTTEEERARFASGDYLDPALPPGGEDEPDPVARVVYRGYRPYLEVNGGLMEPLVNNMPVTGDPYNESAIVRCAQAGFKIVLLTFLADNFYKGEGKPCDFSAVDKAVRRALELAPDSYVMVSLRFTMAQWANEHPDEQVGYPNQVANIAYDDEFREPVVRPSSASGLFRDLSCGMIREFGEFVEGRPWGKRLIGLRPSYGVYTEWCCYNYNAAPDTGVRMREKFAVYEKTKRGIDNAQVPTLEERRHEHPTDPDQNGDLLDPSVDQLIIDYYECMAETTADLLLAMAKAAKDALPGRLVGAYYGYLYALDPPEGTTVLMDKVLSSPYVDFLSNPPYYKASIRRAGGAYSPRAIPTEFRRYNKLSLVEDDSRFHHIRSWLASDNDGLSLATETSRETEMCMRRNWLNMYFDGDGIQINDPITQSGRRPHAFDDPAVFKAIADSRTALAAAGLPSVDSSNDVAVVFSGRERLRRDGGKCSYFSWNLYETVIPDFNRTGAAFDFLTLEDYLANPRGYTKVIFLNAFYLTAAERQTLIERTRQPGMTTVWFGPAGGVTDAGFSDAAMSELTGITAAGVARRSSIYSNDSAANTVWGTDFIMYQKTFASGARSFLVPEAPYKLVQSRELMEKIGAWMYTGTDSYFRRHGDVFMFHTGTAGTHKIKLPEKRKVRELFSGTEYDTDELTLTTDGPNTWLFKVLSADTRTARGSMLTIW